MMSIGKDFSNSAELGKTRVFRRAKKMLILNIELFVRAVIIVFATMFMLLALWGANGLLVR